MIISINLPKAILTLSLVSCLIVHKDVANLGPNCTQKLGALSKNIFFCCYFCFCSMSHILNTGQIKYMLYFY